MKIKTIGILIGTMLCLGPVVGHADDDDYQDFVEEDYEDYEVFDDIEDLIDEELIEDVSVADVEEAPEAETSAPNVPAPRAVSDRMSCVDIETRIAELRTDVKSYPELRADLEYMLSRQRNQCAPRATRRPVHNYKNVNPVMDIEVPEVEVATEPVVPEKTAEEIAAEAAAAEEARLAQIAENFANGLCGDGTKPNKYGCCEGEVFKQVEHLEFACCPKDGDGECREPFKKK